MWGGGGGENPEKKPRRKARTTNKLNPHMATDRTRTQATLVAGERSHHPVIPAPLEQERFKRKFVNEFKVGLDEDASHFFFSLL